MRCASTGAPIHWLLIGCQTCKTPVNVWPANTKPAVLILWWPHFLQRGSLPLFHALLQSPKTLMSSRQERPLPKRDTTVPRNLARCPSSLTQRCWCMPPRWEKTRFSLLLHRKHQTYAKTLYQSPASPQKMQLLKQFLVLIGSSAWTVAHFWVHVFTPITVDASHHKNAIQGEAKIPTSAVHWATAVLCSTPLVNWKLEQFIIAECP